MTRCTSSRSWGTAPSRSRRTRIICPPITPPTRSCARRARCSSSSTSPSSSRRARATCSIRGASTARRSSTPTPAERARRLDFLERCAQIAVALGGDTISLWSGIPPPTSSHEDAWRFLADGVRSSTSASRRSACASRSSRSPACSCSSLADWERLRDATSLPDLRSRARRRPRPLHRVASPPATRSAATAAALRTVHLDDTRNGVHEHLQIGDGRSRLARHHARARRESASTGIASVELSRHSHAAPEAARTATER